jgi:hypothetical protein
MVTRKNNGGQTLISLSRTTVEVSHVAAGEHMVPGPFHLKMYIPSRQWLLGVKGLMCCGKYFVCVDAAHADWLPW